MEDEGGKEMKTPGNISVQSFLWDDEEGRSIKKPGEGTRTSTRGDRRLSLNSEKRMTEKAVSLIREIDKEMREIRKVVGENQNTKKEIKSSVKKLSGMISQLTTREVLDALEGPLEGTREIIMVADTAEAACQTTEIQEKRRGRNGANERIRQMLEINEGYEAFQKVAEMNWPEEIFERTEVTKGNPVWENKERVKAIMVERGSKMDKGIARQYAMKFPELLKVAPEQMEEGCEHFTYETKIERSTGIETLRVETTKILIEEEDKETFANIEGWKEKLVAKGISRVALVSTMKGELLKKMTEYIFRDTEITVGWYVPQKKGRGMEKSTENNLGKKLEQKRPERNTEALVVTIPGKQYTELRSRTLGQLIVARKMRR